MSVIRYFVQPDCCGCQMVVIFLFLHLKMMHHALRCIPQALLQLSPLLWNGSFNVPPGWKLGLQPADLSMCFNLFRVVSRLGLCITVFAS